MENKENLCPNCGNKLNESENLCRECGYEVSSNSNSLGEKQAEDNGVKDKKETLTFVTAFKNFWYGKFEGRCSRREWWLTFFYMLSIGLPAVIIVSYLDFAVFKTKGVLINVYSLIVNLIFLKAGLTFSCRRLHDLNMSGWWQIVFFAPWIPLILLKIVMNYQSSGILSQNNIFYILMSILIISFIVDIFVFLFFMYFIFTSGTPGSNKYGQPSKY